MRNPITNLMPFPLHMINILKTDDVNNSFMEGGNLIPYNDNIQYNGDANEDVYPKNILAEWSKIIPEDNNTIPVSKPNNDVEVDTTGVYHNLGKIFLLGVPPFEEPPIPVPSEIKEA